VRGKLVEYRGSDKLKDLKALITGGDSGIGRSVAKLFAREGADVTIVYLEEEQQDAEDTKKMVEEEGKKCLLIPFDLQNLEGCKTVVDKHMKEYGALDCLVNNASKQIMCKDFKDIDLANVRSTFESNILQMFAMTKFALPHMKSGATIINTTSVTAFKGSPAMVDYSSTKGAIVSFTKALAQQLYSQGLRVNAVAPGPILTPLQPASRPEEQMEDFASGTPIGRTGQPSEVAPSYVFLASPESVLFSGQVLHPNLGTPV